MQITIKKLDTLLLSADICHIFKDEENVIFLDSAMKHEKLGKYSFIGVNPYIVLKGNADICYLNDEEISCDVFEKIDELLKDYKVDEDSIILENTLISEKTEVSEITGIREIPFIGGCIGYFSYDAGLKLENIEKAKNSDLNIPEYYFNFYDNLIIFDHQTGGKYISACGVLKNINDSISNIEEKINMYVKEECNNIDDVDKSNAVFISNFSKEEYIKTVSEVKEHIRNGDVYIANLTQRFVSETKKDSFKIYDDLRRINPAPFSTFMKLDGFDIISSSPERFLQIKDRQVETRPIKGTRPRGKNLHEDLKNKNELINSEKDKAELLMVVDLERNDLSKVCKPFSVNVSGLYDLEEYSTVFHLVATVRGELKNDVSLVQCFKACFPGGSITGTPKNSAMQIIKELEVINRSLYTGCIGYFSFDGNADFNIVIRTIIKKDDKVYLGVGGGITWDSDEESEYQETLDKAKALMRVI